MTKFVPGQSGNPKGKLPGTLSRRTQLAKLLEPHAEELVEKAVELAKNGEVNALRLCLERLIPRAKGTSIELEHPFNNFSTTHELLAMGNCIIEAVVQGKISPEEGKSLLNLLVTQLKIIETNELAQRVNALEKNINQRTSHE